MQPSVQECPAYYICKSAGASCEECLRMTTDQWRNFVKTVLGQLQLEISWSRQMQDYLDNFVES